MTAWLLAMRSFLFFYTVIMPQGDNWRQLGACRAAVPHRTPEDLKPAYHQIFGGLTVDKKCFYIAFQKSFLIRRTVRLFIFYCWPQRVTERGPEHDPNWAAAKVIGSAVCKTARHLRQFGAWVPCCQFNDPPRPGNPYLLVSHWDGAGPLWWWG